MIVFVSCDVRHSDAAEAAERALRGNNAPADADADDGFVDGNPFKRIDTAQLVCSKRVSSHVFCPAAFCPSVTFRLNFFS